MTLSDTIQILQVALWPLVALTAIFTLRPYIATLLSGSKVKLSLFGQSIETTLPELKRIIEEQTGGPLAPKEAEYLNSLYKDGAKVYPNLMTSDERKLVRPLRNYGLVMTSPRNSFLGDAKSIQLSSLGSLYMKARK